MKDIIIRSANISDADALAEIYRPYVENTAISFEYIAPTAQQFEKRISKTLEKYPYIVLVKNNVVLGYCYIGALKTRPAYDRCVEISIYLRQGYIGNGYGKMLYSYMEEELKKLGILNVYVCITYAEKDDEYHNNNSYCFHQHMGYKLCGKFNNCGYKFNRWYSVVWMEKMLGSHNQ